MNSLPRILFVATLIELLSTGCVEDTTDTHRTVALQDATSVDVTVVMNNGDLEIFGGSSELLEADLTYPVNDRPRISYLESDGVGHLDIIQPDDDNILTIDENDWDLQLNGEVELALYVEMDSGDADLDLGSLAVSLLDFDMDNGDATFDLTGLPSMDLDAHVHVDNGHVHLLIPPEVAAQISVDVDWGDVDAPQLSRNARGDYIVEGLPGAPMVRFEIEVDHGDVDLDLVGAND